jgi:hypothetical protein
MAIVSKIYICLYAGFIYMCISASPYVFNLMQLVGSLIAVGFGCLVQWRTQELCWGEGGVQQINLLAPEFGI